MRKFVSLCAVVYSIGLCCSASAQDLQFLSLRNRGGELALVGDYERNTTGTTGSEGFRIFRRIATQRLNFSFDGSFIHPRFMRFSGSTGMIFSQGGITGNDLNFPTKGTDINYNLSGSLLPEHPVSFHYLTNRGTTVIMAGQLQGYRVKQIQNSIRTSLGRGLPISLSLSLSESSRKPDQKDAFIEEQRDQTSADFTLQPFGILRLSSLQFRQQQTTRPFYDSILNTRILNSRHVLVFDGDQAAGNNQLELAANILDQKGSLPVRNERYSTKGRFDLPGSFHLNTTWNYHFQRSKGEISRIRQLQGDLNHQLFQNLMTQISGDYSIQNTRVLKTRDYTARISMRYSKRTRFGRLEAGMDLQDLYEDRDAGGSSVPVVQEELVLVGFNPVYLYRDRVVQGSIAVFDSLGITRFVENVDYVLRTLGVKTGIERLATGRIADGDRVLVDYEYEIGGAGRIESRNQGWNIGITFSKGSRVYIRRRDITQDQLSGDLDVLLNPADSWIVGATMKILGCTLRTEYEDQNSRVSPFLKKEASLGTRVQLEQYTDLGLTVRRLIIDNKLSPFGSDLWGGQLSFSSIPISRVRLTSSFMYEVDTGANIDRRRTLADIRAATRYGQTTVSLTLQYGRDLYGSNSRIRSLGRVELVRSF